MTGLHKLWITQDLVNVIEQSQKVETFILGFQSTLGPKPTRYRMCGVQNKLEQTFVQLEGFQLDLEAH